MNKTFIKLCLASILSLSLNTNLQAAQEITPAIQTTKESIFSEETLSKINGFVRQERTPVVNLDFMAPSSRFVICYASSQLGQLEDSKRILNNLCNQEWVKLLKVFEIHDVKHDVSDLCNVLSETPNLESLTLVHFDLEAKYLNKLAPAFSGLSRLQTLNLRWYRPNSGKMQQLCNVLLSAPNLKNLDLANANLTEELASTLARMTDLQRLSLTNCTIRSSEIIRFTAAFKEARDFSVPSNLQHLNLSANNLGKIPSDDLNALGEFLSLQSNLQVLNLGTNNLGKNFPKLAPALKNTKIRHLKLTNDRLETIPILKWQILKSPLANLQILDCGFNDIGLMKPSKFKAFVNFLSSLHNLQELKLPMVKLEEMDTSKWHNLKKPLDSLTNLKNLDLSVNPQKSINKNYFNAFVECLLSVPQLQSLDLHTFGAGKMDLTNWEALMSAISFMPNLQKLDLRINAIRGGAMTTFISAISQTESIAGIPNLMNYSDCPLPPATHSLTLDLRINSMNDKENETLRSTIKEYNPAIKVILK